MEESVDRFLAGHEPERIPGALSMGERLGAWQVVGLLGKGGSGEVYRLVSDDGAQKAAVKVLTHPDARVRRRFASEVEFLREHPLPQFPKYYADGTVRGCPYVIFELLEPIELPKDEKGIVTYLLAVCRCVAALHQLGWIHRDLKPKNIMRRPRRWGDEDSAVLIDFGLAKAFSQLPLPRSDVSIVSGHPAAVGTPGYAAPEQLVGDEVTPATDIHALGCMVNRLFNEKPPRNWEPIVRRATSSLSRQRYQTVEEFATAIRRRNYSSRRALLPLLCGVITMISAGVWKGQMKMREWVREERERALLRAQEEQLGELVLTNVVRWSSALEKVATRQGAGEGLEMQEAPRAVTNQQEVTLIQLGGQERVLSSPLRLTENHEYWIVGPGNFDAFVTSSGTNTTIRLKDCLLINRSTCPPNRAGIRYVSQGDARLFFLNLDAPDGVQEWIDGNCLGFNDSTSRVLFRDAPEFRPPEPIPPVVSVPPTSRDL